MDVFCARVGELGSARVAVPKRRKRSRIAMRAADGELLVEGDHTRGFPTAFQAAQAGLVAVVRVDGVGGSGNGVGGDGGENERGADGAGKDALPADAPGIRTDDDFVVRIAEELLDVDLGRVAAGHHRMLGGVRRVWKRGAASRLVRRRRGGQKGIQGSMDQGWARCTGLFFGLRRRVGTRGGDCAGGRGQKARRH